MNAAFMLVTTAWLAGGQAIETPAPTKAPPSAMPSMAPAAMPHAAPASIYAPSVGSGCSDCGGCGGDCGCDCGGHSWRDKMRGWFHHDSDCGCEKESGHGHTLADKLHSWFHRSDCCEPCGDCGCGGGSTATWSSPTGTMAPPRAEPIKTAPKEVPAKPMPSTGSGSKSAMYLTPVPAVAPAGRIIIEE